MERFLLSSSFICTNCFQWSVHLRTDTGRAPGIILGNIFVRSVKFCNLNCELWYTLILTDVGCELLEYREPNCELVECNLFQGTP